MHSFLKSFKDNCSFLMALALLTYLADYPFLPGFTFLIIDC